MNDAELVSRIEELEATKLRMADRNRKEVGEEEGEILAVGYVHVVKGLTLDDVTYNGRIDPSVVEGID